MGQLLNSLAAGISGAVGQGAQAVGVQGAPVPAAAAPSAAATPLPAPPPAQAPVQAPAFAADNPAAYAPDQSQAAIYDSQSLQSPNIPAAAMPTAAPAPPDPANPYAGPIEDTPKEIANSIGTPEEDISVTGDNWHPHKMDVLTQIADFFLKGRLAQTNFKHNFAEATKGMDKEPDRAISRVRQFAPQTAYNMYKTLQDDRRADSVSDYNNALKAEKAAMPLRAMLGAIQRADNDKPGQGAAQYQRLLPKLRQMRDAAHLTENNLSLPDDYDPILTEAQYMGGVNPNAQERLERTDRGLDQKDRGLDQKDTIIENTDAHADVRDAQGAARIAQGDRRLDQGDRRGDRQDAKVGIIKEQVTIKDKDTGRSKTETVSYPKGTKQIDPSGTRLRRNEGGRWVKYLRKADGKWYRLTNQ